MVPDSGDVLEFGCGNGLVALDLALSSPHRNVHGVDIDARRVAAARRAAQTAGLDGRVSVELVGEHWVPMANSADAVVIVDVLYLLGPDKAREVLTAAVQALRPGGMLVIKETSAHPRWKTQIVRLQETLAVHVLRITVGTTVQAFSVEAIAEYLEALGWEPTITRIDQGHLHAHAVVTAKYPEPLAAQPPI